MVRQKSKGGDDDATRPRLRQLPERLPQVRGQPLSAISSLALKREMSAPSEGRLNGIGTRADLTCITVSGTDDSHGKAMGGEHQSFARLRCRGRRGGGEILSNQRRLGLDEWRLESPRLNRHELQRLLEGTSGLPGGAHVHIDTKRCQGKKTHS